MLAAFAVLVSHSYALSLGNPDLEPFVSSVGISLGRMAVDVFFITSGFLICGSLFSRRDAIRFIVSRCLRIYPALIVVVLASALLAGPLLSELAAVQYFSSWSTWTYIAKSGSIIFGHQQELPGVFQNNPGGASFNGSLWTLQYELLMYCLLFGFGMIVRTLKVPAAWVPRLLAATFAAGMLVYWAGTLYVDPHHQTFHKLLKLFAMFWLGSTYWWYRGSIPLKPAYAALAVASLVLGVIVKPLFLFVYPFAVCYLVFFFVFQVKGSILHYNRLGDYSYGIYILAYPIQQYLAWAYPGIGVGTMIILTALIAMPLSVLSWVLIESKALAAVPAVTQRFKKGSLFISENVRAVQR